MTIAANIANNADALKAYGIEVANQDGSLRSTYDVLKDLSEIWGTMTDTERVALGQVLAGKNQFKVLTSVLQNFSHAIEATETAYNSAGSAAQENAKYMESLEAKTTNLSATFQKLANDIISKELVGSILDLTNGLVGLADTGFGQVLTKAGLFAGAGFGLSQLNAVTKFLPTLIGQFTNLGAVLSGTMGIASGILPILLALGVAIFGVVEAVKALKTYQDEHTLEGIGKRFQDESAYVQEFTDKLEECKKKLEELNAVDVKDRGQEWANEKAYVEEQIRYYEYLLNMHKQQQAEVAQEYRTADKGVGFGVTTRDDAGWDYDEEGNIVSTRTAEQQSALSETYRTEADAVLTLAGAYGLATDKTDDMASAVADLKQQLEQEYGIIVGENIVAAEEYNNLQVNAIQSYLNETNGLQELTAAQKEQQLSLLENNRTLFDTIVASDNLTTSEQLLKQSYIDLMQSTGTLDQYLVDLANTLGIDIVGAAQKLGIEFGSATGVLLTDFQQLADGTWVLRSELDGTADSLDDTADSINNLASSSYTGSEAAWQIAQELLGVGTSADDATRALYDLVAQEIIFNNSGIDVSQQISALQALASQAGITADAIASVTNPGASIARAGQSSGYISQIDEDGNLVTKKIDQNASKQWALQQYYQSLMSKATGDLKPLGENNNTNNKYGGGGGGSVQKAKDEIEKNAQSTLNNISSMTSQTIDNAAKEAQEKAKKTLDAIKKAVKEFYDERINALKEQNEEIDKQVQLEEKLKALEEAKNKQILLYENGEYHYGQDLGAIASAQKDYDKFVADMERDEQIGVLEDTRDKILKVLEQIESNIENYTETQLASIGSLSTSVTSSIENITNIVGNTSSGIFAALQGLLSGSGSSGSLDLSALMSLLGGGSSGSSTSPISSHLTGENLLAGTYEELVAHGGNVGYKLREAWGQTISQDEIDRLTRLKLSDERNWKQGQLLSLAYMADTDIPLDVQWWMSIFEAEMSDIVRGYTGNIGGGADPRGLDPDAAKHVDIQYWLDAITNAKDIYEAMDYYARAVASGYVLAEYADGYFDALGYKNFDPKTIKQDMRNAYSHLYINNPDFISKLDTTTGNTNLQYRAGEAAWYFNQNDLLDDLLWSQLTAEQVWKYGGDMARSSRYGLESTPLSEAEPWQQENAEAIAARNRQYLLDELYRQIDLNSAAWFEATEAEKEAYHLANEYYREIANRIESGDYEGLGGWMPSAASPYMQGILNDQNGKGKHFDSVLDYLNSPGYSYTGDVVMIRNGEVIAPAEDVIPEIAESLGIPTDYGTTTGVAAQGSILEDLGSNGTTNYNINIDNIELPGVVDSNGFISGLRNLAYQYAYTRQ